jgi:SAM-dependent methyltransferase
MSWILRHLILILFLVWLSRQVRKPGGALGRRFVRAMGVGHAAMTDWALQPVTIPKDGVILDVGCGGGRPVNKLARLAPQGRMVGLDYSAASVAGSRNTNARQMQTGRVQIEEGSVAAWPFPDGTSDAVTAVETRYHWPGLACQCASAESA